MQGINWNGVAAQLADCMGEVLRASDGGSSTSRAVVVGLLLLLRQIFILETRLGAADPLWEILDDLNYATNMGDLQRQRCVLEELDFWLRNL